jgi:hypothetical protein
MAGGDSEEGNTNRGLETRLRLEPQVCLLYLLSFRFTNVYLW